MTTGERIKYLRKQLGMTQEELGEKIGVQKAAINKYETGIVVDLKRSKIAELAKALDCSPLYLLEGSEDELSEDEKVLVDGYRSLTPDGKKYMLSQLVAAKALYGEKDISSSAAES